MSMYHKGRQVYRQLTRQRNPLNPSTLTQSELLQVLSVNPKAVGALLHHAAGDLFTLADTSAHGLTELAGVGEGTAKKVRALIDLAEHYTHGKPVNQRAALEPLVGKLEAEALLERGAGDLFNLRGADLTELAELPRVGMASAARLVAVFELVGRYAARRAPASPALPVYEAA